MEIICQGDKNCFHPMARVGAELEQTECQCVIKGNLKLLSYPSLNNGKFKTGWYLVVVLEGTRDGFFKSTITILRQATWVTEGMW